MRSAWILPLPAAVALGASCILPSASVTGTGGGSTTITFTSSTGGARPDGGSPVVPPAPAVQRTVFIDPSGPAVTAASGNPGQRHLIHSSGYWWMFYAASGQLKSKSTPDTGASVGTSWLDGTPATWDFGAVPSLDGRSFGVDVTSSGTSFAVHFSLSSGNLTKPLSHLRTLITGSTIDSGIVEPVLSASDVPVFGGDGTVTAVGRDSAHTVVDVTSIPQHSCDACAVASSQPETGGSSWSFGTGTSTNLMGPPANVRMRSTIPLAGGTFVLWRAQGSIYWARQTSGTAFGTATALTNPGPADDSRTFASCTQPPARGRILDWAGGKFTFRTFMDDSNIMSEAPPPEIPVLRELFLSCGPNRVHAFAVAGASNTILGASWDTNLGWSGWETVVDGASAGGVNRCFLTGFDRVAGPNGDTVGLAWSEASLCGTQVPTRLFSAFTKVADG